MSIETVILIALQFIGFAFLFGRQTATLKALHDKTVGLEVKMEKLTETMTELAIDLKPRHGLRRAR